MADNQTITNKNLPFKASSEFVGTEDSKEIHLQNVQLKNWNGTTLTDVDLATAAKQDQIKTVLDNVLTELATVSNEATLVLCKTALETLVSRNINTSAILGTVSVSNFPTGNATEITLEAVRILLEAINNKTIDTSNIAGSVSISNQLTDYATETKLIEIKTVLDDLLTELNFKLEASDLANLSTVTKQDELKIEVEKLNFLSLPKSDRVELTAPNSNTERYTYKLSSTTVAVVDVVYTDSTKITLNYVARIS